MPLLQLGPVKRGGPEGNQEFASYVYSGGLNVKATLQTMADEELSEVTNFYLRADGGLESRRGYQQVLASGGLTTALQIVSLYQFEDSGTSYPNGREIIYYQGLSSGTAGGYSDIYASVGGATPTKIGSVLGRAQMSTAPCFFPTLPNAAGTNIGAGNYLVICTGSGGPYIATATQVLDMSVTPTASPAWASVGYARWCQVVNSVLWFGFMPGAPNQVYGMTLNAPLVPSASSIFVMSLPVTALSSYGEGVSTALVVGMTEGLSLLYGVNYTSFYEQQVPYNDGPISQFSMINFAGNLYFLGNENIYQFNGQNPDPTFSQKIEPIVQGDTVTTFIPMLGNRQAIFAFEFQNKLYWFYDSTGAGTYKDAVVYDLLLGGWTHVATYDSFVGADQLDSTSSVYLYAANCLTHQWEKLGAGNIASDNSQNIQYTFTSKYYKLGMPGTQKSVYRVYPEFFCTTMNGLFGVTTDYGLVTQSAIINPAFNNNQATWDSSSWDNAVWGSNTNPFQYIGPPATRIDFQGVIGEAFAFNFSQTAQTPPFVFAGATGNFRQRGRT